MSSVAEYIARQITAAEARMKRDLPALIKTHPRRSVMEDVMPEETALQAALNKAGVDTDTHRLFAKAVELLRAEQAGGSDAAAALSRLMRSDHAMRLACAQAYIEARRQDMTNNELPAASQKSLESRHHDARAGQGDGGQSGNDPQGPFASSPEISAGRGQEVFDHRIASAPVGGKPRPAPNPPRGAEAIARAQSAAAQSLLVTLKVRDGRSIGAVQKHELRKIRVANEREARLVTYIDEHYANVDPFAFVRDFATDNLIAAAVKFSQEAANVR